MIDPDVNSQRVEWRGLEPHRGSFVRLLWGQFSPAALVRLSILFCKSLGS
jgi:hypothetical protein